MLRSVCFSLLVAQPLVVYTKRFLKIASCYEQKSAYFIRIGCGRARSQSDAACDAFGKAVQMTRNHPVRCLEISIKCATLLQDSLNINLPKPREILVLALSHPEDTSNVATRSSPI